MSARNPHRPFRLRSARRQAALLAAAAGLVTFIGTAANAAVTPGETFLYDYTELTGPKPGETGTVDFTLGSADAAKPGWFTITAFDINGNVDFCKDCLSENLNVLFDSKTDGVAGSISGTYLSGGGQTHQFDLVITDLPNGAWTFDNYRGASTGTYTVAPAPTAVDEPAIALLLAPAAVALLISRRRRDGV